VPNPKTRYNWKSAEILHRMAKIILLKVDRNGNDSSKVGVTGYKRIISTLNKKSHQKS
jgi:hypothetical protein